MDRSLAGSIRAEAARLGFDMVGITDVRASDHAAFYRSWIAAGRHGTMDYLAREDAVERRLDATSGFPDLRSAIVVGMSYHGGDEPEARSEVEGDVEPAGRGIIARYARGRDYHKVIRKKLLALLRAVESELGRELPLARAYVDTGPVLEREFARRAGLGWYGRSSMLINPRRGSYFFLGSLLLEIDLPVDAPFEADHCGTCSACVDSCPTGALLGRNKDGAPVIDATKCISYLTIENRGSIPRELRPLIGNRIFGCDICQEVCPFTRKFSATSSEAAFAARAPGQAPVGVQVVAGAPSAHPGTASPSLIELLETALDEGAWDAFSMGSPIRRAGRAGFARNACVGLGNWGSAETVEVLAAALEDSEPLVRSHAAWALGRVGSAAAADALLAALESEEDGFVREELESALESAVISRGLQQA